MAGTVAQVRDAVNIAPHSRRLSRSMLNDPVHALPAMSRAFVKESDGDTADDWPVRPLSPHPNRVTRRGLSQLHERLAQERTRLAGIEAVSERRRVEREIVWLEARIAAAIVVPLPAQHHRVGFGATVTVQTEGEAPRDYRIVGEDEAAPDRGSVSWVSPLARALDGARVGDVVTWSRPAGEVELEVLDIRYADDGA